MMKQNREREAPKPIGKVVESVKMENLIGEPWMLTSIVTITFTDGSKYVLKSADEIIEGEEE